MTTNDLKTELETVDGKMQEVREALGIKENSGFKSMAEMITGMENGDIDHEEMLARLGGVVNGISNEALVMVFSFYGKVQAINKFTGYDVPFAAVMAQIEKTAEQMKK